MSRSHVTHVKKSCHACERVMSHMWKRKSHVTHVKKSWHACERVMSHMWKRKSHVTHAEKSCHACERVMSRMWKSHVTHVKESCFTCDMSHRWVFGVQDYAALMKYRLGLKLVSVTWLVDTWLKTHVTQNTCNTIHRLGLKLVSVTWLVDTWHDSFGMWHDLLIRDMAHCFGRIYCIGLRLVSVTWHWSEIGFCNMAHSHVTWPIHMWHDSSTCDMTQT